MDAETISAIANVITGLSAGLAVIVAREWRDQQRELKQAEVAGQALAAFIRFTDGLTEVSVPSRYGPDEPWEDTMNRRWSDFRRIEREFNDVWNLAETHLDDPIALLFRDAWQIRSSIWASQITYRELERQGSRDQHFWELAYGETRRGEIAELRTRAKTLLKPLAQLRVLRRN